MQAGAKALLDDLPMGRCRRCDDGGVDVAVAKEPGVVRIGASRRLLALERCQASRRGLGARDKPGASQSATEDAGVVRSPMAETDERDADEIRGGHQMGTVPGIIP